MRIKHTLLLVALLLVNVLHSMAQHPNQTGYVSWSPDGTMLAVAFESQIDIVDTTSLEVLNSFTDIEVVGRPVWSPDGTQLAFGNRFDVEVWLQPWDAATAEQVVNYKYYPPDTPRGQLVSINDFDWSPDGTKIASAAGSAIDIWEVTTGELLFLLPIKPVIWDIVLDLDWSSDNRLVIGSLSDEVYVLDGETGEVISVFWIGSVIEAGGRAVDFNPDNTMLVIGTTAGRIEIWEDTITPGLAMSTFRGYHEHSSPLQTIDWRADGKYIASAGYGGQIRIWEAETGDDVQVIELGEEVTVMSVAWSPDGTQLAYTDDEGMLQIIPAPDR